MYVCVFAGELFVHALMDSVNVSSVNVNSYPDTLWVFLMLSLVRCIYSLRLSKNSKTLSLKSDDPTALMLPSSVNEYYTV